MVDDEDDLDVRLAAQRRAERKLARAVADNFLISIKVGRTVDVLEAAESLRDRGAWPRVARSILLLEEVREEARWGFWNAWIQLKSIPREIGNRRLTAAVLRKMLPKQTNDLSLRVYRGADVRRAPGFSWTKSLGVARRFAGREASYGNVGIILEAFAPPDAILQVIDSEDIGFSEREVIVDPFMLETIRAVERIAAKQGSKRRKLEPKRALRLRRASFEDE